MGQGGSVGNVNVEITADIRSFNTNIQSAVSGITQAAQTIANQAHSISNATQGIANGVTSSMGGIASASNNAAAVTQGATNNIASAAQGASSSIASSASTMTSSMQSASQGVSSSSQTLGNALSQNVQHAGTVVQAAANQITSSMQQAAGQLQNITVNITNSFNQVSNSASNMAQNVSSAIQTFFLYKGINMLKDGMEEAITVYNKFEASNMGLRSMIQGQGRDFQQAKGFIDSYISDGLIPMTDAVTAYKNLASRGYSDEQIKNTMNRLKDASAFGRRASLDMGSAVRTASEGLKNENSLLVDNSGITKNVSQMWADYARSIGVGEKSLTKTQKIQAEVNGIMQESRFQMGDAAKYAGMLGGQMQALSKNFMDIKNVFGAILSPAVQAIVGVLKAITDKFLALSPVVQGAIFGIVVGFGAVAAAIVIGTVAMAAFAAISAVVGIGLLPLIGIALAVVAAFGALGAVSGYWKQFKDSVQNASDSAKKATNSQLDLGDSVKKTGKKIQDNLQSFDEIHQLQTDMGDSAADAAKALADSFNLPELPTIALPNLDDMLKDFRDKFVAIFDGVTPPTLPPPNIALVTAALQTIEMMISNLKARMPVVIGFVITDVVTPVINGIKSVVQGLQSQFPIVVSISMPDMQAILQPALSAINNFAFNIVPQAFSQLTDWLEKNWKPVLMGTLAAIGAAVAIVFGGEIVAAVGLAGAAISTFVAGLVAQVPVVASATGAISTSFAVSMAAISLALVGSRASLSEWITDLNTTVATADSATKTWSTNFAASMASVSLSLAVSRTNMSVWLTDVKTTFATADSAIKTWATNSATYISTWVEGTSRGIANWVSSVVSNMSILANQGTGYVVSFAKNSWNAFSGFLDGTSNGMFSWAKSTIDTLYTWAVAAFDTIKQIAGSVGQKIEATISRATDNIKSNFNGIGDWVSDNKSWLIPVAVGAVAIGAVVATGGLAALAAPEAIAAAGLLTKAAVPAFATGTNYVPEDMLAMIHEGEEIVPKKYNPAYTGDTGSGMELTDNTLSKLGSLLMAATQFSSSSQSSSNSPLEVKLYIDGSEIARATMPHIDKETDRRGKFLISAT